MAERTSGSGGIPGRISRLRMRKRSELDRDSERRDQRAALLFDVLHPVALLGSRSRRVLDDAGAHQHVRLSQLAARDVLQVHVDSERAAAEVERLVDPQVELGESRQTPLVVPRIVVVGASSGVPCLLERRLFGVVGRVGRSAYRAQFRADAPCLGQFVSSARFSTKRLSQAEAIYRARRPLRYSLR